MLQLSEFQLCPCMHHREFEVGGRRSASYAAAPALRRKQPVRRVFRNSFVRWRAKLLPRPRSMLANAVDVTNLPQQRSPSALWGAWCVWFCVFSQCPSSNSCNQVGCSEDSVASVPSHSRSSSTSAVSTNWSNGTKNGKMCEQISTPDNADITDV